MAFLKTHPQKENITFPVLVPNLKGLDAAIAAGATEIAIFGAASEGFSKANINCSIDESLVRFKEVCSAALSKGIRVRGYVFPPPSSHTMLSQTFYFVISSILGSGSNSSYISCVVACPYDGPTPPSRVLHIAQSMLSMGCYEISLGDTIGVGTPHQITSLLTLLLQHIPASKLAGHFHDTYGQGVANAVRAYEMGVRVFDASVAGLGGCPYAKGAKGNVATEDLVYWYYLSSCVLRFVLFVSLRRADGGSFHEMGVKTGVDLDALVEIGEWISKTLDRRNESRAGAAIAAKRPKPAVTESPVTTPVSISATPTTTAATATDASDLILVSRTDSSATITLNNPRKGNSLTLPMITSLKSHLAHLSLDPTIQSIVLTNTGKFFCTGMDLSSSGPATSGSTAAQLDNMLSTFESLNSCPKPTIALIRGGCYGGGVGLAFCCDVRVVVGAGQTFVLSEVKRGLIPATISKYVVREWGTSLAREAMITGRPVAASELHKQGIVHAVVETEEQASVKVREYVDLLRSCAPRAVGQTKELVNAVAERTGEGEAIRRVFMDMMGPSEEAKFGIGEFRRGNREVDWGRWYREKIGGKAKL